MSIAVICLAYLKNPSGAALLASYFSGIADIYLHVDAKSDEAPYRSIADGHPNLILAERRLPIFWGGFNTVQACVATIEQALRRMDYGRILFITEDTIPIIDRATFLERMASDTEWIQTGKVVRPEWRERYDLFFYYDSYATTPRPTAINEREWTPGETGAVMRLEALRRTGKAPLADLYSGGTWWALSRASIDKFLTVYHQDTHLRESFEFSAIPEEQYIHSVLGPLPEARPLVFADWTRNPRPYVFRTAAEIRSTDTKGATMIRKVPLGVSEIERLVRALA